MSLQVLVLGMHRSGTSVTMRALEALGLGAGPVADRLPANEHNSKGYFERRPVAELNDLILAALGGAWDAPPRTELGWEQAPAMKALRQAVAAEVKVLAQAGTRALKDPRLCLTGALWKEALGPLSVLICLRHPLEVAASLAARDHLSRDQALRLWSLYTLEALRQTRGSRRLLVPAQDWRRDPAGQLERLAAFLEQPLAEEDKVSFGAWLQDEFWHQRHEPEAAATESLALRLWQRLSAGGLDAVSPEEIEAWLAEAQRPLPRVAVFTAVTASHLAGAKVLLESLRCFHPDWERHLCLVDRVDGRFDPASINAKITRSEELGSFHEGYTPFEACCAAKAFMAAHLFERAFDQVFYLDADICLEAPLDAAWQALQGKLLVLTPHRLAPGTDAARERNFLRMGAFNAGFLALARHPELESFLAWWKACLAEDCLADPEHGIFVDQRWLDLAPGLFSGLQVLRHPGYNLGHWNLDERPLSGMPGDYAAAGQPLVFFHYSGLPEDGRGLSIHRPDQAPPQGSPLAALLQAYRGRLKDAGEVLFKPMPWALGSRPAPQAAPAIFLARLGLKKKLFQQLRKVAWLHALRRRLVYWRLSCRRRRPWDSFKIGVDLVGYLRSESGVGESSRIAAHALEAAQVPFDILDVSQITGSQNSIDAWAHREVGRASRKVAVIHVNGGVLAELPRFLPDLAGLYRGQRMVGVLHWELPVLARSERAGLPYLDELWAPSRFIQAALRAAAHAKVPVLHMPHAVQPEPDPSLSRADLGLPEDRFIFASFFDALSMPERKNPLGAVRAFQRAFTPGDRRAFLLVKGNRAHLNLEAWSQLRHQVQGWPNIRLWDQVISRPQVHRLIQLCDAVLSLHRSEGFGLVMAEAMALGRVAVATGWSGNLDFMDESNSALVRYDLVKVGKDIGPYEAWQDWAEPDEEHAAALMRRLVEDPSWAAGLAARGAQTLAGDFSYRAAGERMRRRLLEMGAL